jgi:hypothetical protein
MRNGQMMFVPWMFVGPVTKGKDDNLEGDSGSRGEDAGLGAGEESGDRGSRREDGGPSQGNGDESGDKNCTNTRDAKSCGLNVLAFDLDGKIERMWVFVEEHR